MRIAPLGLIDGDRDKLEAILRAPTAAAGLALLARIGPYLALRQVKML